MSFPSRLRHKQLLQAFYLPIILPNIFTVSVSTTIGEGNNHMNAHSGQVNGKTMVSHDKLPKIHLSVKKKLVKYIYIANWKQVSWENRLLALRNTRFAKCSWRF